MQRWVKDGHLLYVKSPAFVIAFVAPEVKQATAARPCSFVTDSGPLKD